eukprot:CAMPEP_0181250948 /NCGR_PEP_ID=MMETSP1096-20121128/46596_1 /TAXON_ID=156174 ORGANISM="Chrysochromulina ericina, Strain CCMP281" /NCGR_SAMPLE_ID=MMETSP1096 /ASSEMBLY_ACC=CAM_ASM_000453 /LENGTH=214 /DNA_ID=CAMNT_0023348459 /DNA_START=340 /DNA_END=981 /DNA_ORIENTATION=+
MPPESHGIRTIKALAFETARNATLEALALALLAFRLFAIAPREMHSMSLVSPDTLCERVSFALDELQHCKFARRTPVLCAFVILATLATALLDTRCARGKADAETLQATRAVTTTNRRSAALRVRSTADLHPGDESGRNSRGRDWSTAELVHHCHCHATTTWSPLNCLPASCRLEQTNPSWKPTCLGRPAEAHPPLEVNSRLALHERMLPTEQA